MFSQRYSDILMSGEIHSLSMARPEGGPLSFGSFAFSPRSAKNSTQPSTISVPSVIVDTEAPHSMSFKQEHWPPRDQIIRPPDAATLSTLKPITNLPSLSALAASVSRLEQNLVETQQHLESLACLSSLSCLSSLGMIDSVMGASGLMSRTDGPSHGRFTRSSGSRSVVHLGTRIAVPAQHTRKPNHVWHPSGLTAGMSGGPGEPSPLDARRDQQGSSQKEEPSSATVYGPAPEEYGGWDGLLRPHRQTQEEGHPPEPRGDPALRIDIAIEHSKGALQRELLQRRLASRSVQQPLM